ncbi:MAG: VOC family protein [Alphaproteobacteria bacterium]|nr:VOC family protein [Alphaproteobacteria bacterium]
MSTKPQAGEFCWNELMTSDTGKAKEFYGQLFGWTHQDMPMKNMTYTMFNSGEKMVGGLLQIPPQEQGKVPPHWMSYILVASLDESLNKAETLGAKVKMPPTTVEGMGRFAVIQDPTDAHIALWESAIP